MKKLCSKCKCEKDVSNFSRSKNNKSGYKSQCKECIKEYSKEYNKKYYQENKEMFRKLNKCYYENNKEEIKEKKKEQYKIYYKNNKEKIRERGKINHKKWYDKTVSTEEGRTKLRIASHNRRAKVKEASQLGIYTIKEWTSCLEFFNNCDAYTGEKLTNITVDHITPISFGGTNNINNIVPCNKVINSSKGTKNWLEWYRKQPFYSKKRENKINKWISINSQTNFFETIDNCYCEML